jgi:hypothetical protein
VAQACEVAEREYALAERERAAAEKERAEKEAALDREAAALSEIERLRRLLEEKPEAS